MKKKKNKLKENAPKISDEIKENERIEINISKLSKIFEETLNIFFEISNIDKQSKIAIDIFLDDLCKWCIAELKSIIEYLLKDNLNQ